MRELDSADIHILRLLALGGRISVANIGRGIELTAPSIHSWLKAALRKLKVIKGYSVEHDTKRIGESIIAFIDIDTRSFVSKRKQQEFKSFFRAHSAILKCRDWVAKYRHYAKVQTRDHKASRRIVSQIRQICCDSRTRSRLSMATLKHHIPAPLDYAINGQAGV